METHATRTRGEDIFIAVKNTCMRKGLDLKNLRGICTDGAPAMTGNTQGFVARFWEQVAKECDNKQLINLRCIIHEEALCAKSVALSAILKDVNRILFIHTSALHHRQFREFWNRVKRLLRTFYITLQFVGYLREKRLAEFCSCARK